MRNAQSMRNFKCSRLKKIRCSKTTMANGLAFVAAFGGGIAQRIVDNLPENLHQFVGFLNHGIELRRQQPGALAYAESEPSLFCFLQRDPVLRNEIVVT
jgi:hypothetical protein